jgi:hypothetical protein
VYINLKTFRTELVKKKKKNFGSHYLKWNLSESISVIPQYQVSLKIRVAGLELLYAVSNGHADARSFAAFNCERGKNEEKFL